MNLPPFALPMPAVPPFVLTPPGLSPQWPVPRQPLLRPAPLAARQRLLTGPPPAATPLAVGGPVAPYRFIEPGLLFFTGGAAIGGPSESYRGVSASAFPTPVGWLGHGAPIGLVGLGIAGRGIGF